MMATVSSNRVLSLHIAPSGAAPMQSLGSVNAVAGRGLEDDRYYNLCGTYSNHPGDGRQVTLIEIESLEALRREYQIALSAGLARRNIVTRGVALNHFVEREFRVGEVTLRGTRLCEPCLHLEKLTQPGTMRGLIHRGGLRAEVMVGGVVRVGDGIVVLEN